MLNKPMDQWSERDFLRRAYIHARDHSPDPSTQCGAVLLPKGGFDLVTFGTNCFPQGIDCTPEMLANRETKYFRVQHAERDCILKAALNGFATHEATLYCPWFSCAECAKAIICAGIKRVVGHRSIFEKTPERWMATIREADKMLDEAGVKRVYLEGSLFHGDPDYAILFNGERWIP